MTATLLVELLCEELPPRALPVLARAFEAGMRSGLLAGRFIGTTAKPGELLATPRRLAVIFPDVRAAADDIDREIDGPPLAAKPEALAGFARKHGLEVAALIQRDGPKGRITVAKVTVKGAALDQALAGIVSDALRALPAAKLMRWGAGEAQFVRPVHGLVMMHGARVVPGTVLGLASGDSTRGHRFMSTGSLRIGAAEDYVDILLREGKVLVPFATRRAAIAESLRTQATRLDADLGEHDALLDEVTALVEHPSVYVGAFDAGFLSVPQECLILTMRQNQKYFPLFDAQGRLLPKFLIVSNMQVEDPRHIVDGNQRVVRPRLEDARFFYEQDRKIRLEERVPQLGRVVYHNKLGSQLERVERIQLLAGTIARGLGADTAPAERAAWLAKADLLTGMVGEFPELQGTMGRYYAQHDGEPAVVAEAIEAHYRPRFAGDALPQGDVACALALADKLDSLAGLFGIGQQPTGDKDPFGLRRAALGVVRILVEHRFDLPLDKLVGAAFAPFKTQAPAELMSFLYDRFAGYLKDQGFSTLQVDAVLCMRPVRLGEVPQQLEAVKAFQSLPEAGSLAAANKRVDNILRQAEARGESFANADASELSDPAERALHEALRATNEKATPLFDRGDYTGYLKSFAVLKDPVDTFFEKVMVMVEDETLRRGRLALLRDLRAAMNRVADISRLAA